jgi:hypothetical protein
MNCITKPVNDGRSLRVHVKFSDNKTLCGITINPAQIDLAECNCKRCQHCLRAAGRRRIRGTARLNGRRVSPNQIALIS